jgi:hypothetical protein
MNLLTHFPVSLLPVDTFPCRCCRFFIQILFILFTWSFPSLQQGYIILSVPWPSPWVLQRAAGEHQPQPVAQQGRRPRLGRGAAAAGMCGGHAAAASAPWRVCMPLRAAVRAGRGVNTMQWASGRQGGGAVGRVLCTGM